MVSGPPARVVIAFVGLFIAGAFTPGHAAEKWGPFRGQLVDQATGKGIPGAAVIAIWWKNEPNPIQMNRSFFDAIEAVTDADGRFEIPRHPSPPFFDFLIYPAEVVYFAPGYIPTREEVSPSDGQIFVAPTVVLLRRFDLTNPRDKLVVNMRSRPAGVPLRKLKEFTRAVNVERVMRGFQPLPVPGVDFTPGEDE
jgi:hypothetical protein